MQRQSIPLWAWILIIYLGYDNVLDFINSYWIIPVILLVAAYGTLHALGMGHIPRMIFGLISNTIIPAMSKKK